MHQNTEPERIPFTLKSDYVKSGKNQRKTTIPVNNVRSIAHVAHAHGACSTLTVSPLTDSSKENDIFTAPAACS